MTFRFLALLLAIAAPAAAAELRVGWGSADITPDRPAALSGHFYTRISTRVQDPITAAALAIDNGDDHVVMVSVDLAAVDKELQDEVRRRLEDRLSGFDPRKLFLHATHTHTAPVHRDGLYDVPPTAIQPSE
ncbi:MAG: neutral/alkaline non-lysosomal ceramidase N-terminal domain-containing protein [Bryobacteraceae bacterium]|nr:neutral/alkaline non-lysosomal ceramidase N-terminal domain-containing protein [Bryobacteraceae bacterium]